MIVSRSEDGYKPFTIRKKSGGGRLIAAPEPQLLSVQRWISRNVLANRPVHSSSMAYAPGASPLKCAARHVGARWLLKFDIHDFFESISEDRVYWAFRSCGYQPLIAFELARICTRVHSPYVQIDSRWRSGRTHGPAEITAYSDDRLGHLAQGAPTSPMLSNLVSEPMDDLLAKIARERGLVYTRYSDDVVFSTGTTITRREVRNLVHDVKRVFNSFGHLLHRKKVVIAPPGARKLVLGLLVDGDEVRLSREYRARVESHVRGIEKFGLAEHAASRHFTSVWGMVRHVGGLIAHSRAVDQTYGDSMQLRLSAALEASGWSDASP
ncbi:reverse transcriptase family protein [uncultured Sphingopyxis sp.]|uniref:reverse transcriptase family protein n=1 Tax=uncultured Sphingopyxis sp. TaxID=310581 RepID=UPI0025987644|nr:reverse transcriptase family protein [uncultured Sphingopyxis sp.]